MPKSARLVVCLLFVLTNASCAGETSAESPEPSTGCVLGDSAQCPTGLSGECALGTRLCEGGQWGDCRADMASKEVCDNGVDDDCDGQVDEGCLIESETCIEGSERACESALPGACSAGTETCQPNKRWGLCEPSIKAGQQIEKCDNGVDDDCDGKLDKQDDDCQTCAPGTSATCATGQLGICAAGSKLCSAQGEWEPCVAHYLVGSQAEVCDDSAQLDEDCDGAANLQDSECVTYAWVTHGWNKCSAACGGGTQTRTVSCEGSNNTLADSSLCTTPAPPVSQACNTFACTTCNTMTAWQECQSSTYVSGTHGDDASAEACAISCGNKAARCAKYIQYASSAVCVCHAAPEIGVATGSFKPSNSNGWLIHSAVCN